MNGHDDELDDDYLDLDYEDEDELGGLRPLTSESGDLLDDSNPFGYDDIDDFDDDDIDKEDE